MSIIRSHNITLYGGNEQYRIALRPLTDEHLPYLYRWNADPEVLYWVEGDDVKSYPPEAVEQIYGGVSQSALCFAVEVNGGVIGECWLQPMNLPSVSKLYAADADVRRIDMLIGEKAYWGQGIGTLFIGMLVKFAFEREHVDALHCLSDDYNVRSRRVWEKNGFRLALTEAIPQPAKGRLTLHWRLTRDEYRLLRREGR